jgi:hypothetical protein
MHIGGQVDGSAEERLTVTGDAKVIGNLTVDSTLDVELLTIGSFSSDGTPNIGDVTCARNMHIGGQVDGLAEERLTVTGDAKVSGNLTVNDGVITAHGVLDSSFEGMAIFNHEFEGNASHSGVTESFIIPAEGRGWSIGVIDNVKQNGDIDVDPSDPTQTDKPHNYLVISNMTDKNPGSSPANDRPNVVAAFSSNGHNTAFNAVTIGGPPMDSHQDYHHEINTDDPTTGQFALKVKGPTKIDHDLTVTGDTDVVGGVNVLGCLTVDGIVDQSFDGMAIFTNDFENNVRDHTGIKESIIIPAETRGWSIGVIDSVDEYGDADTTDNQNYLVISNMTDKNPGSSNAGNRPNVVAAFSSNGHNTAFNAVTIGDRPMQSHEDYHNRSTTSPPGSNQFALKVHGPTKIMDNHKLTVTGDTDVGGDLNVTGDVTCASNMHIGNNYDESADEKLTVTGDAKVTGNLTVDGIVKINKNGTWNEMHFFSGHSSQTRLYFKGFTAGSTTPDLITAINGLSGTVVTSQDVQTLIGQGDFATTTDLITAINGLSIPLTSQDMQTLYDGGFVTTSTSDVDLMGVGNITASGNVNCNQLVETSDDRYKENEQVITNATDTLKKLKPQLYDKKSEDLSQRESGLVAQEVWYDAPELRHLVSLGEDADGTTPTPQPMDLSEVQPGTDPDYSSNGWSTDNPSGLNYTGFIAYLIKSNQELSARLDALEAV